MDTKDTKVGKKVQRWDELGDWDWHLYTIDTIIKQITKENMDGC